MKEAALTRREKAFCLLTAAAAAACVGLAFWYSVPLAAPASSGLQTREVPLMQAARVDLNTAGPDALQTLPGVGEAKAQAIVAYRLEHGPFRQVEDAAAVPGLTAEVVAEWKQQGLAYVN